MTISTEQRQQIIERAGNCCEYCRIGREDRMLPFHVDHIIARKHGGTDEDSNLCLACYKCNGFKGSNVAAIDPATDEATRLFHPRNQQWDDHFLLNPDGTIEGLTPEGRTTIAVLRLNDQNRVQQSLSLTGLGRYPCEMPS